MLSILNAKQIFIGAKVLKKRFGALPGVLLGLEVHGDQEGLVGQGDLCIVDLATAAIVVRDRNCSRVAVQ